MDPPCLFLGIIATATSVGIPARILSEKRKTDSPEGVTILASAVMDDVMGIVLLAMLMGMMTASRAAGHIDWMRIAVIAVKAVGVWLAATIIGLIASRKISFLLKLFGKRSTIAIMALGLTLILSGLFEEAGLAMIIGAYVMGLSLSNTDISNVVRERLNFLYELLVPVFFCVTGMGINLMVFDSPWVLLFGLAYAVTAFFSKVIGCGGPAMLTGFNFRGALRIGIGMAPRCEVALIIAGIGLTQDLMSPTFFAAAVIMVVVNMLATPPLLIKVLDIDKRGTRKPVPTREKMLTKVAFQFPSPEMTEFLVNKLISVFESEGFFVHLLNHQEQLYQLRKDVTVIDFRYSGTEVEFNCGRDDVPFINTAVYIALGELEQVIRALEKTADTGAIATKIQAQAQPPSHAAMDLRNFLKPECVTTELKSNNKWDVIDELLALLARNGEIKDIDDARRAVVTREESMSTGLQHGVAIPHGKTDSVNKLVVAIGIKQDGLDFNSLDKQPAKIIILSLSPKNKPAPHVQFLSTISQLLTTGGREKFLASETREELYKAITSH
jgi:Kef-type K+ transport system membrane component KefB/mannitol/fructose-specific phosphotransferase system IIA component (Ntr-type)